jgi:hypothetical protein
MRRFLDRLFKIESAMVFGEFMDVVPVFVIFWNFYCSYPCMSLMLC